MNILGISGFYHDAAAALVRDGEIIGAAQEERFTRLKHDPAFPVNAIEWCLAEGAVDPHGIDVVVFYEKPFTTFARIMSSYASAGPRGLQTFHRAMPEWLGRKLWTSYEIERGLRSIGYSTPKRRYFAEHHMSHAAAAFYPSPFDEATVLTFDGVGEWATSSVGVGRGRHLELLQELRFPNSLGLLYSAFTYQAGFRVNSGEYKLMGLAPYGRPVYEDAILEHLIGLAPDGSFTTDLKYFDYVGGRKMTNRRFDRLFGGPPRAPEGPITERECDLAASIQKVITEIVLRMGRHAHALTGIDRAVLAGGVALNCVSNAHLLEHGPFDELWVQPAAGDAGSALGCALWAWHELCEGPRSDSGRTDSMRGTYLGPSFDPDAVAADLDHAGRPHTRFTDRVERDRRIAQHLADGDVVAVFEGGMEFGPRALGHRSILADARSPAMQLVLNEKVKGRESFRPFAPAVLADCAGDWFDLDAESPYMVFTVSVRADRRLAPDEPAPSGRTVLDQVKDVRSTIPAVTHVDGSARVQTVDVERFPSFHGILTAFDDLTGCPVLVNTSFNVRGEPIVCTPEDAYRCFMTTGIDWLVLEDCLLDRREQPDWSDEPAPIELD